MVTKSKQRDMEALRQRLEDVLFEKHGPMIGGKALYSTLGYTSASAFRQAVRRDTLPLAVFSIANRKGKFALTFDVAAWLAKQKYRSDE